MKKNGFIATSILYSFFLVFLTLFLALVANYLHNQNLIRQVNNESKERLAHINNYTLKDLKPGDSITFKTRKTDKLDFSTEINESFTGVNFLKDNIPWVFAYKEEDSYVFISSSKVIDEFQTIQFIYNSFPMSIKLSTGKSINEGVNGLKSSDLRNITGKSMLSLNLEYGVEHEDDIEMSLLNLDILRGLVNAAKSDTKAYSSNIMKDIMVDIDDEYDLTVAEYSPFSNKYTETSDIKYYTVNRYTPTNTSEDLTTKCGISQNVLNSEDSEQLYVVNDEMIRLIGYSKGQNSGVINETYNDYIDYCLYATLNESLASTNKIGGNRLYLKINVKDNNDLKIDSGNGSVSNPYNFSKGK